MNLIVPRNGSMTADFRAYDDIPESDKIQDIDVKVPEFKYPPRLFRIAAMFVGQRKVSKGGILLPAETLDTQNWTHQLVKIVAVGDQVDKGPAYEGYDIREEDRPEKNQLWLIDPKQPRRVICDGFTIILINDDQLWWRVDPSEVGRFTFNGLEM